MPEPRISSRVSRRLVISVALALPPLSAGAQEARDTTSLSPVVVTATKGTHEPATSTAATTILTAAVLREKGIVTVADALREVTGVTVNQASARGSQTALFVRGGNSNFTKVLIDGVPVNAPGGALDLSTLTVDNIDRIEIVRGPASVQYGTDAMTGVIQIFTRRGRHSAIDGRVGSRDGEVDARVELARETHASMRGARLYGSIGTGIHRGSGFLPFNNQHRNHTASLHVGAEAPTGTLALASTYSDSRYHYPTTGSGVPEDSNAYTGARRLTIAVDARWRPTEALGARLHLGSAETRSVSSDEPDSPGDDAGFYSSSRGTAVRRTAELQLSATARGRGTLTAGAAVEGQQARSTGRARFGGTPLDVPAFDESRTNRGVYLQVAGGGRPFSFDLGVRREDLDGGSSVNTGRVGVASEIVPGSIVRASLGSGFKEPAFEERFNTAFATGNPQLRPERNRSREVGAETRLPGGLLTLGLTAFHQRFEDLVQYRWEPAPLPHFYNVREVVARGWELEGRTAVVAGASLRGTYTFVHTEVEDAGTSQLDAGKPLYRRPRRTATLDAAYRVQGRRDASFHAILSRVGARDDMDFSLGERVRLAPYTRLDLAAQVELFRRAGGTTGSLTLRGENVANADFENVAGYETPGRILFIGMRLAR